MIIVAGIIMRFLPAPFLSFRSQTVEFVSNLLAVLAEHWRWRIAAERRSMPFTGHASFDKFAKLGMLFGSKEADVLQVRVIEQRFQRVHGKDRDIGLAQEGLPLLCGLLHQFRLDQGIQIIGILCPDLKRRQAVVGFPH